MRLRVGHDMTNCVHRSTPRVAWPLFCCFVVLKCMLSRSEWGSKKHRGAVAFLLGSTTQLLWGASLSLFWSYISYPALWRQQLWRSTIIRLLYWAWFFLNGGNCWSFLLSGFTDITRYLYLYSPPSTFFSSALQWSWRVWRSSFDVVLYFFSVDLFAILPHTIPYDTILHLTIIN